MGSSVNLSRAVEKGPEPSQILEVTARLIKGSGTTHLASLLHLHEMCISSLGKLNHEMQAMYLMLLSVKTSPEAHFTPNMTTS